MHLEQVPAPPRLAPHAFALAAEVTSPEIDLADIDLEDSDLATGRLVLLHDPKGQDSWQGEFRLVSFVRAVFEPEIVADPLLSGVGWDWLMESLTLRQAAFRAASGTITRVVSESFGELAGRAETSEFELRASWTPDEHDLGAHLEAWTELLCTTAGLAPVPAGPVLLRRYRQ